MKRFVFICFSALIALCMVFAGCSAKSSAPNSGYYMSDSNEASFNYGGSDLALSAPEVSTSHQQTDILKGRKIIRDAQLEVQSLDFDAFLAGVTQRINELGGYVESNSVTGQSYTSGKSMRSARLVARIPAEKLDEFLTAVDGMGNVISREEGLSDVTDTYVDIEARLASLRTEYDTLLGLLEKAESLEDIITLQDRLTDVRYQLESYEARLRSYDSQIAFSTVSMSIREVERETPVEEESFGEEVRRRFGESLEDVGDGARSFAAWFLGELPQIFVWLMLLVVLPLVIVLICVKSAKRRAAKRGAAGRQTQQAQQVNMAQQVQQGEGKQL